MVLGDSAGGVLAEGIARTGGEARGRLGRERVGTTSDSDMDNSSSCTCADMVTTIWIDQEERRREAGVDVD